MRVVSAGLILASAASAQVRFDIADVHRSASATNPQTFRSGGLLRGERYYLRKTTMLDLIRLAYGSEPDDVLGGPAWLALTRFDIAAKAGASTSAQNLRLMLQLLLAERFALALHKDVRPVWAFALKLGKDEPKLRKTEGRVTRNATTSGSPARRRIRSPRAGI